VVSALFLNLYLLPLSLTTTTLYVLVGVAPPAFQFQATYVSGLSLTASSPEAPDVTENPSFTNALR